MSAHETTAGGRRFTITVRRALARWSMLTQVLVFSAGVLLGLSVPLVGAIGSGWPVVTLWEFVALLAALGLISAAHDDDRHTDWRAREQDFIARRVAKETNR